MTAFPLQIFYDGACRVCSSEMDSYRKRNPDNRLEFVDISAEGFDAQSFGKTQAEFMAQLHVRDADGNYATGVDAFILIWQAYPSGSLCRLFAAVIGLPGLGGSARLGYRVFARYRHLLPKKDSQCKDGSCNMDQQL